MTTSKIITLCNQHLQYDLDSFQGQTPEDDEWIDVLNWAQRTVARTIEPYDPLIPFTLVVDQHTYDIRSLSVVTKKVVRVDRVYVDGNPLYARSMRDYGLWSLSELQTYVPTWFSDGSGTPTKAVSYDTSLILHPKPSSVFANTYIAGIYFPADLTDPAATDATPDLPEEIHEALALLAAIYAADPNVSEQEGLARLSRYGARQHAAIRQVQLDFANSRSAYAGSEDSYTPRFMTC